MLTDSQGRFFFANLPAAAVVSLASKIGYTSLSGARRVELVAGGRITDLKIPPRQAGDDGGRRA